MPNLLTTAELDAMEAGSSGPKLLSTAELDALEKQGDFVRGAGNAFKQIPQLGYGLMAGAGAAIENVAGEGGIGTGIKKAGVKGYQEWGDKIGATSKESDSLSYSWDRAKAGDPGALVDWLQYGLGYAAGQGAQMLATAGVGSLVGKFGAKVVAEKLASGMIAKEAARIGATQEGARLAESEAIKLATANVASKIGQTTAIGAQSFGMEGGEIFGDLVQRAEKEGRNVSGDELAKAFGASVGAGALEFVGDKIGLDLMLGKSAIFKPAAGKTGLGGRAARGALGAVAAAPIEAGTEYLQTGIEEFGKGTEANLLPFNQSPEAQRQAFDAAGLGAIGGVAMGGAGGVVSSAKPAPKIIDIATAPTIDQAIAVTDDLISDAIDFTPTGLADVMPAEPHGEFVPDNAIEYARTPLPTAPELPVITGGPGTLEQRLAGMTQDAEAVRAEEQKSRDLDRLQAESKLPAALLDAERNDRLAIAAGRDGSAPTAMEQAFASAKQGKQSDNKARLRAEIEKARAERAQPNVAAAVQKPEQPPQAQPVPLAATPANTVAISDEISTPKEPVNGAQAAQAVETQAQEPQATAAGAVSNAPPVQPGSPQALQSRMESPGRNDVATVPTQSTPEAKAAPAAEVSAAPSPFVTYTTKTGQNVTLKRKDAEGGIYLLPTYDAAGNAMKNQDGGPLLIKRDDLTAPVEQAATADKPAPVAKAAPTRSNDTLLNAIRNLGGIHPDLMADLVKETNRGRVSKMAPGLFDRRGLNDPSLIAEYLNSAGYPQITAENLADHVDRALNGERILSDEAVQSEREADQQKQYRADITERAKAGGIKTAFRKFADVEADVLRLENEAAAAYDELGVAAKRFADEVAAIPFTEQGDADADALMRALGFTEEEINAERAKDQAAAQIVAGAVEPAQESDARRPGEAPREGGEGFALAGQTADEVAAQERARQSEDEAALTKEQIDREAQAPFSLEQQSQASPRQAPTGGQNSLFTPDGRATVAAQAKPDDTQANAVLDAAGVTGRDRLEAIEKFRAGTYSLEDLKAAYPAKSEQPASKETAENLSKPADEAKPAIEAADNDRDHFTLERLNRDANTMDQVTFARGEYVRYLLSGKTEAFGEIDGISHAKREFSVDGLWYPFGAAYKAERPTAPKPNDAVPLSSVIDAANAKHGDGLTEADRVPRAQSQDEMHAEDQRKRENPNIKTSLSFHNETMDRIRSGLATLAEYKAAFQRAKNSREELAAEFSAMKKDDILRRMGGQAAYRYKSEKKDRVVQAAVEDVLSDFQIGRGLTYSMGPDSYAKAMEALVESTTDDYLSEYAERIKEARAGHEAQAAKMIEAVKDPKTLEDFNTYARATMAQGKTFAEARMTLTPEQRARYDELAAAKTRDERKARADQQQTDVRVAAQTTEGQIVETKHTRTGEPLFVVKAAERVERDIYTQWLSVAKRMGGWYSSFRGNGAVPGFQFKTREDADAFLAFIGGNAEQAKEVIAERRDAFADDRSQSAVERLTEMADRMEERADESLGRERKANTERRARFAASAEAAANSEKALAKTMRNIASAIENGTAQFLDRVRQKTQVEALFATVRTAKDDEIRAKYPSYADQERHKGESPTAETADYATWPQYTAYRSDLARLGRELIGTEGTKLLGQRIMKVADDVSDVYTKFAKDNLLAVSRFGNSERGGFATFASKDDAERSISVSNLRGVAVPLQIKRGEYRVILSPSEAMKRGIWQGDHDKRITLDAGFGKELVEKIGKASRRGAAISVPWQFESAHDKRAMLARMGIETPAEFRAMLREFIGLREQPKGEDKIKAMERAMIGRAKDGLDFFPTPESVAQEMVDVADIKEGMSVLEPSAGMGHIAEQIRAAGVDPDVVEMSNDRKELLEAKGFRVVGRDFMDMTPRDFTFGDTFRAPDGSEGIMRGLGGLGSNRVRLVVNGDERTASYHDRDELTPVAKNGSNSGYDRILMNPPFSDRRDAEHVQHAYTLLRPGGRLVAIMGEGVFFGQDKKAQDFRDWLEQVGGTEEKLPEGTFMDPSLPVNTATNARMVVIEKPDDGGTRLSRGAGTGMARRDAQAVVDRIAPTFKNLPPIHLVDAPGQAPKELLSDIRKFGALADVEAAFHNGEFYVFLNNLSDEERLEHVLFRHEVRHYGFDNVFGDRKDILLGELWAKSPAVQVKALALKKRLGLSSNIAAVEELLADMPAEDLAKLKGWHRITLAVRDWLQAHGFENLAKRLTDLLGGDAKAADLMAADMVRQAQAYAKDGSPSGRLIRGTRLSAPDAARAALEWKSQTANEVGPVYQGDGFRLEAAKKLDTTDDFTGDDGLPWGHAAHVQDEAFRFSILDAKGNLAGFMDAEVSGLGEISAIHDMAIEAPGKGFGSKVVETIMASTYDGVRIIEALDQSKPFWNRLGAQGYDQYQNTRLDFDGSPAEARAHHAAVAGRPGQEGSEGGSRFSRAGQAAAVNIRIVGDSSRAYTQAQKDFFARTGRTVDVPTIKERIASLWKDAGKKLAQGVVDQFAPIKELGGQAYTLARLSKGAPGALEAFLHHGKLKLTDGVYDADTSGGVVERLAAPLQGEMEDFLWWVAAHRAERLSAEDREHLFTPADILAGKSLHSGTTNFDYTLQHGPNAGKVTRDRPAIFADSLKTYDEFNRSVMDIAEQSGLIDGEARKIWEHEMYVPFYRASEEEGGFVGARIGQSLVRQTAFKQLKGGTDKLNSDLLANTLQNWAHLIDAAAKNRAAKATLEAAERVHVARKAIPGEKKTVWYMDRGQKQEYKVDDPYLMTAISSLEYAGLRGPIMDTLSQFKHWLTIGVTASPAFKVRNLIRDSLQAMATGDLSYNPAKNVAQGWKLTDRDSQEYVSMLASGALIRFGTMEGSHSQKVRRLVAKGVDAATILDSPNKLKAFYAKYVEPGVDAYNEIGNRGEEINRAALYQQLRDKGIGHAEASLMARDLMDFSMQGSWNTIRFLSQVIPFFNARLVGLYKLGRAAKQDPARFAIVTGGAALASIALLAMYHDDDDWKKREDFDRESYWWFKFGGTAFRIPKPFEIGAIATLAERSVEYLTDQEMTGERLGKRIMAVTMNQLSMNPVPQAVKPIIDLYANKDSFTGRPIETMGMDKLDSEYRYNANTSMVARALSTGTGGVLSPVQYDHLVRSYFGWLGSFTVGAADMMIRPATNEPTRPTMDYWKFATQGFVSELPAPASRYVSQMYDQAKELEQAYSTYRDLVKRGKVEEAKEYRESNADKLQRYRQVEHVKKKESQINQRIRLIENGSLSPDEKKQRILALQQQKDRLARSVAPGYSQQ